MAEVLVFDPRRALERPLRWMIGMAVSAGCRQVCAALVGAEGSALASRARIFASHRRAMPRESRKLFQRLRSRRAHAPAEAALLAAQLAEQQAVTLEELASTIAPIRDRVLAVAVDDPGLWCRSGGLIGRVGLCDAARLAELTGFNVIDAFAARDLAQSGAGRPLLPIPHWVLLHDLQKTRALVQLGRQMRITHLPGSRDASGAARVARVCLSHDIAASDGSMALAESIALQLATALPQTPRIDEIILSGSPSAAAAIADPLAARLSDVRLLNADELGMPAGPLRAAGVAVLGLLHLDQTPANATALTGARIPRVLGRLTPGSLASWHRLVRELARAQPSVVSLRSAV